MPICSSELASDMQEQWPDELTLDGKTFALVLDHTTPGLINHVRYICLPLNENSKLQVGDPEVIIAYIPQMMAPRPSHGEECPICMEMTDSLALELPCGHIVCWDCSCKWIAQCRKTSENITCPMCRDATLFGNFYEGPQKTVVLDLIHNKGRCLCPLTCISRPAHLTMTPTPVLVLFDCVENTWFPLFEKSEYAKEYILSIRHCLHHSKAAELVVATLFERCGWCGKKEPKAKCSKCKRTYYCGKKCQRQHWRQHRLECHTKKTC